MIPPGWREYRREDDDELLGFLGQMEDGFRAYTTFGYPIGQATDEAGAERSVG